MTIGLPLLLILTGCVHVRPEKSAATAALTTPPAGTRPATSSSTAVAAEDLEQIREVGFRDLLADARPDQTCFIAFGRDDAGRWIDPPGSFFRKLADLRLSLRRASEADTENASQYDRPGHFRGIRDAAGRPASIYYVRVSHVISPVEVEIKSSRIEGPLNGGGFWYRVKKQHGRWKLDKYAGGVKGWMS